MADCWNVSRVVGWRIICEHLVPNNQIEKSKCFTWCRLGARKPFFLSLSCTDCTEHFVWRSIVFPRFVPE